MPLDPSEQDLRLDWRLRADIQIFMHEDNSAILKDPLNGSYMLLVEHEFATVKLLERSEQLSEWHERVVRAYPASGVSKAELKEFLVRLCRHQILQSSIPGSNFATPATKTSGIVRFMRTALGACFRIRIPLTHPTRFAELVAHRLRFLFTRTAAILYTLLIIIAVVMVTVRFAEFREEIPAISSLLGVSNLPYLLLMFVFVKFLHEAGHIVTCTHFGAKVRDCGLMLLFLTPVLYTNVSDSWILPRKQRMLVSAAGILVELGLAAFFVLLWWITAKGQIHYLLINGILLCTVSTLIFNGNPFMKFDGYFVLADLIHCPNLYQRSIAATQEFFSTIWIGSIRHAVAAITDRRFLAFGVMVCVYRCFLCLGICSIAGTAVSILGLNPMDLPVRGALFLVLAVMPVSGFVQQTIRRAELRRARTRMFFRTGVLLAGIWLVLSIPIQSSICVPCVFVSNGTPIYADLTGTLQSSIVYGEHVESGQEIAQLQNDDLQFQLLAASSEYSEKTLLLENLRRLGLDVSSELLPTAIESTAAAESQLNLLRQQADQLRITAPGDGVLQPPEDIPMPASTRGLTRWSGTPLSPKNIHTTIDRGTLLGYSGSPNVVRVVAILDDEQAKEVFLNGVAQVMLLSGNRSTLQTNVSDLSSTEVESLPKCLVSRQEYYSLVTDRMASTRQIQTISCKLSLNEGQQLPALYSSGMLKIQGVRLPLRTRIGRFLQKSIFRSWL